MSQFRIPGFSLVLAAAARPLRLVKDVGTRVWANLWLSGGLIVVVVGLGVGLSVVLAWQLVPPSPQITVAMALDALDSGNLEVARAMADELRLRTDLSPEEQGTPSYILGVILAGEIEQEWRRKERSGLQILAAGYLEESRAKGFPSERAPAAELLLGKLHFDQGRFAQSLPPLTSALATLPDQASSIHRYLADANLRCADPDWQQAQEHLEALLKDETLDGQQRGRAGLDLARVYLERDNVMECESVLTQVGDDSAAYPEALMLRGRLFMRAADELAPDLSTTASVPAAALQKYVEAATVFDQLATSVAKSSDLVRQARYLRAVCLLRQGKQQDAETELGSLHKGNFHTHEGLAAALALAELQQAQRRDEEATATFRSVVTRAGEMDPYENRWVPLTFLRTRLSQAYQKFLDDEQFERALVIAEGLAPIASPERSVELAANAERAWAEHLQEQATQKNLRLGEKGDLLNQSADAWMRAGRLFERLARLRYSTRQFPDDVWSSANCFFQGHEYERTARLLKLYMENQTRTQRPPALTLIGEAYLAQGDPVEALKWLTECIQFFPKDPHSYRARIVAAKANRELGKLDASRQLLIGNLEHEALTPRSLEWRESKFELGRILHQLGVTHEAKSRLKGVKNPNPSQRKEGLHELELARDAFQMAIEQLKEAVERDELAKRDPFEKQTLEALFFIAESHRQSAKFTHHKIPTVIEAMKAPLTREMIKELNAAANAYLDLQKKLNEKQEQVELTPLELQLLRNCYFARADALYDLGEYDLAGKAYSTATNRYQWEPESLEAYIQIANCHRHAKRPNEARKTLELAKVVLERIRPDADFNKTTRYTREEWAVLLDWLTAL